MIRKFEEVNKSFNSYKALLSKVLTKARENSTTKTYSSYFEKWKIWATQFPELFYRSFTSGRVSYSTLHDPFTSNKKNIPSY